jgi:hypothetical protein
MCTDGKSLDNKNGQMYIVYNAKTTDSGGRLTAALNLDTYIPARQLPLELVHFLGVKKEPKKMILNGQDVDFSYDAKSHILAVQTSGIFVAQNITMKWSS